jgi:hypothetical protein
MTDNRRNLTLIDLGSSRGPKKREGRYAWCGLRMHALPVKNYLFRKLRQISGKDIADFETITSFFIPQPASARHLFSALHTNTYDAPYGSTEAFNSLDETGYGYSTRCPLPRKQTHCTCLMSGGKTPSAPHGFWPPLCPGSGYGNVTWWAGKSPDGDAVEEQANDQLDLICFSFADRRV